MNTQLSLGFLMIWRLSTEKGTDLVVKVIESLIHDKKAWHHKRIDQMQFFVFGEGVYKERLMQLSNESHIHVFWRQSLETIQRYVPSCHYALMPSMFLETFGKSALDALAMGLPVIGFAKWGLEQFIDPELDIEQTLWSTYVEKLKNLLIESVKTHHPEHHQTLIKQAQNHAQKYDKKNWLAHFKTFPLKGKKILMVTDFVTQLGGIETYCHETAELLTKAWYDVELIGLDTTTFWWMLAKKMWFFLWFFNLIAAVYLWWKIKNSKPDSIWFHSVLRYQWWLPLWVARMLCNQTIWMMHDFWYLFAYPSHLHIVSQLPKHFDLQHFVRSSKASWISKIFVVWKYFLLKLLWIQLKQSIMILVPSQFMKSLISQNFLEIEKKIDILPHFTTLIYHEKIS